jgi:hypothetical protein
MVADNAKAIARPSMETYMRKNKMYVAELSYVVKLDKEMFEFEFQKLRASNTLDYTGCQAFITSSPCLNEPGYIVTIFINSS